jgi:hypothetical protein
MGDQGVRRNPKSRRKRNPIGSSSLWKKDRTFRILSFLKNPILHPEKREGRTVYVFRALLPNIVGNDQEEAGRGKLLKPLIDNLGTPCIEMGSRFIQE